MNVKGVNFPEAARDVKLPEPNFAAQYQREFTAHQRTLETLRSTEAELGRTRALLNDERAERDLRDNPGGDIPFAFPGGAVSLPIPTRAALILSAKQWATAGRERALECGIHDAADGRYIASCCELVEKTLDELVRMENNK